jgi:hypothetical protein
MHFLIVDFQARIKAPRRGDVELVVVTGYSF